jgi:hypothetical protein
MSSRTETSTHHRACVERIGWLMSFVVPVVVLLVLLLAAEPSKAVTVTAPHTVLVLEEEGEEETGEEGEEETEGEELETASASTRQCSLRSANAHAVTKRRRLKLTVGYTAYEPVDARVEIRSGGVQIGSAKRHLGRSGVLRFAKKLGEGQKANRLEIRFRLSGCEGFQTVRVR